MFGDTLELVVGRVQACRTLNSGLIVPARLIVRVRHTYHYFRPIHGAAPYNKFTVVVLFYFWTASNS